MPPSACGIGEGSSEVGQGAAQVLLQAGGAPTTPARRPSAGA